MNASAPQHRPKNFIQRIWAHVPAELPWLVLMGVAMTYIAFPIQRVLLVLWVRGYDAYVHQGIRVLKGKPARFSDGQLVPDFPDFVLAMAMFFIVGIGVTGLYLIFLNRFERRELKQVRETAMRQVDQGKV